jgi:hypothetical protein
MSTAPFVRTASRGGKLSVGRVPVEDWAAREKVDVQLDYITALHHFIAVGETLRLTIAAEPGKLRS